MSGCAILKYSWPLFFRSHFEIWHAPDGSDLAECGAVSLGEWFPSFQRIVVPSSSRVSSQPSSFRSSGICHPMTRHHIAERLNPQQHHCKSLRSHLTWCCLKMLLKCLHSACDLYGAVTHHAMTIHGYCRCTARTFITWALHGCQWLLWHCCHST